MVCSNQRSFQATTTLHPQSVSSRLLLGPPHRRLRKAGRSEAPLETRIKRRVGAASNPTHDTSGTASPDCRINQTTPTDQLIGSPDWQSQTGRVWERKPAKSKNTKHDQTHHCQPGRPAASPSHCQNRPGILARPSTAKRTKLDQVPNRSHHVH